MVSRIKIIKKIYDVTKKDEVTIRTKKYTALVNVAVVVVVVSNASRWLDHQVAGLIAKPNKNRNKIFTGQDLPSLLLHLINLRINTHFDYRIQPHFHPYSKFKHRSKILLRNRRRTGGIGIFSTIRVC